MLKVCFEGLRGVDAVLRSLWVAVVLCSCCSSRVFGAWHKEGGGGG